MDIIQPYIHMNKALGKLLEFVAQVLSIIHTNSQSVPHSIPPDPNALEDIKWLSYSLYMTGRIGNSIKKGEAAQIERDCSIMLYQFRQFKKQDSSTCRRPRPEFFCGTETF